MRANNYFLPSGTRAWNRLSEDITYIPAFKRKHNSDIKKPPQYYYSGNRLAIHNTRLLLNCYSLQQNLFLKNITDSPNCECGEIEDTQHYLLKLHSL